MAIITSFHWLICFGMLKNDSIYMMKAYLLYRHGAEAAGGSQHRTLNSSQVSQSQGCPLSLPLRGSPSVMGSPGEGL